MSERVSKAAGCFGYLEYEGDAVTVPTYDKRTVSGALGYLEYIEQAKTSVSGVSGIVEYVDTTNRWQACAAFGYLEYEGDAVPSVVYDKRTVSGIGGYIEIDYPRANSVSGLNAYIEYIDGNPLLGRKYGPAVQ